MFDCSPDGVLTIVDPRGAAEAAALRYVSDARPGIHRKKAGSGFSYTRADGSKLTEQDVLRRIKALAIRPAWTDVWICPFADGHIQATGRDAKGRKQCHARFREVRESTKYEHVVAFAGALPAIRDKVEEHMALRGLPRERVLATVVHRQPMLLQTLRVNRRSDVACNPTINKSLKTGDIYYFVYNKPLVGPFCGEPVKIEVETDGGLCEFSW